VNTKRFVLSVVAVWVVAQVLAILIHGFILAPDYKPFYGMLLRPMTGSPGLPALGLPGAHLMFAIGFVALFARGVPRAGHAISQGARFGTLAWMLGPVPMYLIWFADQPWPFALTVKQIALDLVGMLILGTLTAKLYRGSKA
jgi:hypothetical protein